MRYAICNETFDGWDHAKVCNLVADLGYKGLEIAPFTLAPLISDVPAEQRRTLRKQAEDAGLTIIGLHWLLAKTEGMHLTAADEAIRKKTADYLVELAKCTQDLGGDLIVFGSPGQRRIPEGHTLEDATNFAVDTLEKALPEIADAKVRFCLEPLSPPEADFINTCAQGMEIINRINHPNLVLHLDVKAMSTEEASAPELIRKHAQYIGHFHANDPNLRGPGFGDEDFVPIFQALKDVNYEGWVSVEVFDYKPDPETIARESIRYMEECEAKVS